MKNRIIALILSAAFTLAGCSKQTPPDEVLSAPAQPTSPEASSAEEISEEPPVSEEEPEEAPSSESGDSGLLFRIFLPPSFWRNLPAFYLVVLAGRQPACVLRAKNQS